LRLNRPLDIASDPNFDFDCSRQWDDSDLQRRSCVALYRFEEANTKVGRRPDTTSGQGVGPLHSTPRFSSRLRFAVVVVTLLGLAVGLASAKPPPPPTRTVKLVNKSGGRSGSRGPTERNTNLSDGSSLTASTRSSWNISSITVHVRQIDGPGDSLRHFTRPTAGSYLVGNVTMRLAKSGRNWTGTIQGTTW
jgi:hypothetical protein